MEPRRCASCMRMVDSPICPHCGYPAQPQNDAHQIPVGTVLADRYEIGRVLGQGGFGITYLGWDRQTEETVAVKEFFPSSTVNRDCTQTLCVQCNTSQMAPHYHTSLERFLREARALTRFADNPVIVGMKDFLEENNTAYIVMEYVQGMNLANYIRHRGGRLSPDETFRILRPVMEALAQVHRAGLVHRDISPDNIILHPMGGAKLLDFGAVRSVGNAEVDKALTKSTEAILKHGFAPIEQYQTRGSLGPWTDEYAMCATVWYCLTGSIIEEATTRMAEDIDPDWDRITGLTQRQKKALKKGVSVRAKDRYPDMDGLIAGLFSQEEAAAVSQPVSGSEPFGKTEAIPSVPIRPQTPVQSVLQPSRPPKAHKPKGKKWGLVAAIAAVLVLAITTGLVLPGLVGGRGDALQGRPGRNDAAGIHTEPTPTTEPPIVNTLGKVVLVTDGGFVDDRSFNQACWEGVVQWCEERGVEYACYESETYSTDALVSATQTAIADGADTIVMPGYSFGPALTQLMEDYPDIRFIAVDVLPSDLTRDYVTYYDPSANTACLSFAEEQAGYLAGYAAVMDGYTRLGFLGGMAVPAILRYGSGFIQGADAAAAELGVTIEVRCTLANQFFGSPEITEKMRSWYRGGTEVIFTCGGGLYTSTVEAARECGGYVIGLDVDQSCVDNCILTSAAKNMTLATRTLLEAANTGAWDQYGGKCTTLSLSQGEYVQLPQAPGSWRFQFFTLEQYGALLERIAAGTVTVDSEPELSPNVSGNTTVIIED